MTTVEHYLINGKRITISEELKPGTKGVTDTRLGWTLENEIAWTENYIKELMRKPFKNYKYLVVKQSQLSYLLEQRAWWVRFIDYCNGR